MNKILWIYTETTGLNPAKHGLRELAYILVIDGQVVNKDVLQIDTRTYKTHVEIDDKALKLSNVTIEDFDNFEKSEYQFNYFKHSLLSRINIEDKNDYFTLAGFNVKFDNDFLREWFYDNDAGTEFKNYFHYKVIDVFPLVITLKHLGFINTKNDKLKTVCEHFNIPIDAHNALSDIEATKNLYELISDKFIIDKEELKEKIELLKNRFENIKATLSMPIPDKMHVQAMRELMPSLIEDTQEILEFIQTSNTTKEMFDKAIECFTTRQNEVMK